MIQTILSAIDPAKLASIKSSLIANGIRRVPIDIALELPMVNACGVTLTVRCRVIGQIDASHDEIAVLSGKTREQIDALTAVEVERDAPFLTPVLTKVQQVAMNATDYAAAFPGEPWVPVLPDPPAVEG